MQGEFFLDLLWLSIGKASTLFGLNQFNYVLKILSKLQCCHLLTLLIFLRKITFPSCYIKAPRLLKKKDYCSTLNLNRLIKFGLLQKKKINYHFHAIPTESNYPCSHEIMLNAHLIGKSG